MSLVLVDGLLLLLTCHMSCLLVLLLPDSLSFFHIRGSDRSFQSLFGMTTQRIVLPKRFVLYRMNTCKLTPLRFCCFLDWVSRIDRIRLLNSVGKQKGISIFLISSTDGIDKSSSGHVHIAWVRQDTVFWRTSVHDSRDWWCMLPTIIDV